jgi:predicted permease
MIIGWWHRLQSIRRRRKTDVELEHELQFHIDMLTEENVRRGMAPAAARAAALRTFGAVDLVKADVRDTWFSTFIDNLARDIRYGARTLLKSPSYAATVILVMALGVGANTAIFSVVNGVLLQPLPYASGERLVALHQHRPRVAGNNEMPFSPLEIQDYRTMSTTFDEVVEYHNMWFILLGRSDPERVATGVVSANFFDVFGVRPALGRGFRRDDEKHGAPAVLILSHRYWQRSFGGDPEIVGRVFRMNDRPHTVIGVLPPLPEFPDENDVYMPTSACPFRSAQDHAEVRNARMVQAFARLKRGIDLDAARADLAVVANRIQAAYPDEYPATQGYETRVAPLKSELTAAFEPTLLLLLGTAGFVLLIVCASVANLLLARLARREREMAVRTALGAGRGRLLRQVLTESTMLAIAGGVVGLALAWASLDLLVTFASRFTPRASEIAIDSTVLLFSLTMSVMTGLLFGCVPVLTARRDVLPALHVGSPRTTSSRQRLRSGLIVAQVAISFVLLIGAGLMTRSLVNLQRVDPGFRAANILTMRVDLNFTKYDTPAKRVDFYERLLDRLSAEPGVESVAASATFPLNETGPFSFRFRIEGKPVPEGSPLPTAGIRAASPTYFSAMGIPVLRGRTFSERDDRQNPRVLVINDSLARHHWPGDDPVGRRVSFDGGETWETVVGVVADTRQRLDQASGDEIYWSVLQRSQLSGTWLVETRADPKMMANQVRAALREIDPEQAVDRFRTLDQVRDASLAPPRLTTMLLAMFASLALIVTAAGLAGVIAFSVSQRTHEFGIRMALGARTANVLGMVLREGVLLVAIGLVIGATGAMLLTSLISSLLFGVTSTDLITYGAVATVLLLVALLACYLPARRAAAVDPMIALRSA